LRDFNLNINFMTFPDRVAPFNAGECDLYTFNP